MGGERLGTAFTDIVERFLHLVEKDREFFNYIELVDEVAMKITVQRATNLLVEAADLLSLRITPLSNTIDFSDYSLSKERFNIDLTPREVQLLATVMYERYLHRDIAKLKCMSVNYTPTDLKVYDPSNARSTFMSMYRAIQADTESLIDLYKNSDRNSGALVVIDFAAYDTQ